MSKQTKHGYLIEPEWFSTRETIHELTSLSVWGELAALFTVLAFVVFVVA